MEEGETQYNSVALVPVVRLTFTGLTGEARGMTKVTLLHGKEGRIWIGMLLFAVL